MNRRPVQASGVSLARGLLIACVVGLVYGSLFPLRGWESPGVPALSVVLRHGMHGSYTDQLTNIIVYLPLGALMMWARRGRSAALGGAIAAALVGFVLSISVECAQAWLPGRVPSILDTVLNTAGAFCGAMLAAFVRWPFAAEGRVGRFRSDHFATGPLADACLAALALWALAQLSPWVPSIDLGNLRQGLHPLWVELQRGAFEDPAKAWVYALSLSSLGLLSTTIARSGLPVRRVFVLFAAAVLVLKVPVISRQLSLEAIVGLAGAAAFLLISRRLGARSAGAIGAVLLVIAVAVDQLGAGVGGLRAFNWIPFRGQLTNDLVGISDTLDSIWPYVALACLVITAGMRASLASAVVGAACVWTGVFALEWHQQYLPGRYPDVTDALLAAFAWTLTVVHARHANEAAARRRPHRSVIAESRRSDGGHR